MAGADRTVRVRLIIETPVPGVFHSLQGAKGAIVDASQSPDGSSLVFDIPFRVAATDTGYRFLGDFVRPQGPERRFFYVGVGKHAGDASSSWDRRMKVDVHDISPALIEKALAGKTLEAVINGTGKDGTPACATVRPIKPWRAV